MDSSQSIAEETQKLAYTRTVLAQERTLMAWVRTSLALISFGFTIAKLFSDLSKMDMIPRDSGSTSKDLGSALIAIGTVSLIIAVLQHLSIMKLLDHDDLKKKFPLTVAVAVLVSFIGLVMIANIIFKFGILGV